MMKILLVLAILLACATVFSPAVFAGDCNGCGVFKGKFLAAPPVESKCSGRSVAGPSPSCAPVWG